jgi:hypothetical protein
MQTEELQNYQQLFGENQDLKSQELWVMENLIHLCEQLQNRKFDALEHA